jgi:hypothetical protein
MSPLLREQNTGNPKVDVTPQTHPQGGAVGSDTSDQGILQNPVNITDISLTEDGSDSEDMADLQHLNCPAGPQAKPPEMIPSQLQQELARTFVVNLPPQQVTATSSK